MEVVIRRKAMVMAREKSSRTTGKKRARDHPLRDQQLQNMITNHMATKTSLPSHKPALWSL